ncbi:arylsulfatase A-like enzyme [Kribbella aluminosa]|uniref:Arylsulfatase A-like enzyme n=2 Tax=Kribbella aluminosa TaxID=416017 RepID=A0ABS4UWQ2_9ACTN|nr:sulfatase-like hydrolase/transferase [Kribbella aluminosa]MBP2356082.1 arylsulfatase A-like enzyme [Kribbella aluminosa]
MTDQQRGVTVSGSHPLRALTPRLDAFANDTTTFCRGFTPSPHCCPARASFFTGLYPSEHGVWNNVNVPNALSRGPREGVPFWSTDLAQAGYRLGFTGKWHVANRQGPSAYGWEELNAAPPFPVEPQSDDRQRAEAIASQREILVRSSPSVIDGERRDGQILRPGWPAWSLYGTRENPFGDDDVVDRGVKYIRSAPDDEPFALYVGTLGPHDPYVPPQRFLDLYDPTEIELPPTFVDDMADKPAMYRRARDRFDQLTEREHRAALHHYLAFCSYEDELFGRLLDALVETGHYDNTIVLYVSDHGDYTGEHGLWAKGLPSFLPAYQVPMLIKDADRGPGQPRQVRVFERPTTLVDLGPTLLDLCGVAATSPMSGQSVAADLRSPDAPATRDLVFQSNGNEVYGIQRIVLTDRWKLVVNLFDDDELYDRETDPGEMVNLIARPAGQRRTLGRRADDTVPEPFRPVVHDLYGRLWRFVLAHDDEILNPYILTALATYGPLDQLRQ